MFPGNLFCFSISSAVPKKMTFILLIVTNRLLMKIRESPILSIRENPIQL
jgi:hypothetical protein